MRSSSGFLQKARPGDHSAPTTPSLLTQTAATATSISLSWAPSLDNVGVAGYTVFANGAKAGTTALTSYSITNLSCGKSYTLAVDAYDAAGNHSPQASVVAATAACLLSQASFAAAADTYASQYNPDTVHGSYSYLRVSSPSAPTRNSYLRFDLQGLSGTVTQATLELYATSSSSSGFDLHAEPDSSWQESSLTWNNAPAFAGAASASSGPLSANSWVSVDVTPLVQGNGSDSFVLTSTDPVGFYLGSRESASAPRLEVTTSGGSPPSANLTAPDTQPPSTPSGLSLSGASASSLSLAWSASSDNVGVSGYDLFLNGSKVGTTAGTSYGFGGLSCGQSYALAVDAYDAAGNTSSRASVQASTSPCPDTQPPTTPTLLIQTAATASSISLSWAPSLDNVGVTGYTLYVNGAKAGTTALTLYSVTNLACGQSYTLAVDAFDAAGNHSPQTSVVAATAPCLLPAVPANTSLPTIGGTTTVGSALSAAPGAWSPSPSGYGYLWRRCDSAGNSCSDIGGASASSYTLTSLDQGATLRVAVTASNAAGSATATSAPTALIAAAPPPSSGTTPADFSADPNLTGTLLPWERFDPGNAAATNGINVATQPAGTTSPGIVRVVDDPLGQQGKVVEETVTPTAHASTASNSDSTYLWNITRTPYLGNNGQSNWIHYRMMLPAGYQPTAGEWNVFNEFHNDSNYFQWVNSGYMSWEYPEVALYVTNYVGDVPHLMYRVRGGVDQQGSGNYAGTDLSVPAQLQLGHWYDVVLHIVWSPDPNIGQFEWWLDGQRIASIHRPTLWQRPDGSYDHTDIELNNYRQHATWNATVYYGQLKVGSTQASVGF